MKIALMALGGILVVFGLVDLVGSFAGFDLWGTIGVQLPDIVWRFSAYIELAVGYMLFRAGKGAVETEEEVETENA